MPPVEGGSGRPRPFSARRRLGPQHRLRSGPTPPRRRRGGYEGVHTSPGLELGIYVLVAPEPDRQQPHEDDEVYVVLEGSGVLEIEGETVELKQGQAVFVPAGADHRFVGYEQLSLLVIFAQPGKTAG